MKKICTGIFFLLACITTSYAQTTWGINNTRTESRSDAGLQGNAGAMSGFYQTDNPVNFPGGASSWWHLLDVRHDNPGNNYAMQFAGGFFDQDLYFRKTNSNASQSWSKVIMATNGKVGIGTNAPVALLEVAGDISNGTLGTIFGRMPEGNDQGNGTFLGVRGYATQGSDINNVKSFAIEHSFYGLINSSISFFRGGGTGGGFLTFSTYNNSERMRITPAGDLAIGTQDSHGYKLAVNGSIRSKEVRVEAGPWPDYVFKPAYHLASLTEVESYIARNQHLPGMPSAGQVEKEGINLGEMNKLLTRKIEELTLYLIEKGKNDDLLKKQLQSQQAQINLLKQQLKNKKPSAR